MPKYLLKVNYVGDGVKGLLAEGGTKRREEGKQIIESLGGRMEAFYYAFGDADLYAIGELPDAASAAALALTLNASGRIRATTTVLMTPEEVDAASKKTTSYRAPGK